MGQYDFVVVNGNREELYRSQSRAECNGILRGIMKKGQYEAPLSILAIEPGLEFETIIKTKTPAFSKRIKDLRNERGVSQLQLARGTKIATSSISLYENGKFPGSRNRKRIADFFGVSVYELFKE